DGGLFGRSLAYHIAPDAAAHRGFVGAQTDHRLQNGRTVGVEEERLGRRVSRLAPHFEPAGDHVRRHALESEEWIIRAYRAATSAHHLGPIRNGPHEWILVGEAFEAKAVRVTVPHQFGAGFGYRSSHRRPHQSAVGALRDFGNPCGGREREVILGAVAAELTDVVERAVLETEQIVALH